MNFAVGQENFSIDLSYVHSILRSASIELEDGPKGQIGKLPAKPNPIAVYSLANKFMQKTSSLGPVLVLNNDKNRQAFMLEKVLGTVLKEQTEFYEFPKILSKQPTNFFNGVIKVNDEVMLSIDPILLTKEIESNTSLDNTNIKKIPSLLGTLPGSEFWKDSKKQIFVSNTGLYTQENKVILIGLSISQICEVIEVTKIIPVPCAPKHIIGVIVYRNYSIAVVDIGYCLTEKATNIHQINKLVVTQGFKAGELIAFPLGEKVSMHELPIKYKPCENYSMLNNNFVLAAFELEKAILVIPNVE